MNFLLLIHAIITIALIAVILVQRSEGGGLVSGSGGGAGGMFTARGAANFMTRLTAILATLFMMNCLLIAIVAARQTNKTVSVILDTKDSPTNKEAVAKDTAPISNDKKIAPLESSTPAKEDKKEK